MSTPSLARRQAVRDAARVWRAGCDRLDQMTAAAAARACHVPGGPTVTELEARINADRAARTPSRAAA